MASHTTIDGEQPRHPNGRRVVYPGNLVGSIYASGDSAEMRALLQQTPLGRGAYPIGHYDGSMFFLFPAVHFGFYINAYPTADTWTVHGFINGGQGEVAKAAMEVTAMFRSIGIRVQLAYLADTCSDDAAPIPLPDS